LKPAPVPADATNLSRLIRMIQLVLSLCHI
jgi:hypothetical protein